MKLEALEGVVRRVARSAAADRLVLRGSLITRRYAGALRPVEDVDFLARFPFDAAATTTLLAEALEVDAGDGLSLSLAGTEEIWADTAFPGVRARVSARAAAADTELAIQVDVGFGDPLVPEPELVDDGTGARVLACRPETLFGWKVHGLYERGPGRWRPKDLFDLWLLARHAPLDPAVLPLSVRAAFESRGDSIALTARLCAGEFGKSPWSQLKWASFRRSRGPEVPAELGEVVAFVAATLAPVTAGLGV